MTRSFKITHDRSYWRLATDKVLLEAAQDSDDELAVALGERLDTYVRNAKPIADLEAEVEDLEAQIERLQDELRAVEADLDAMDEGGI